MEPSCPVAVWCHPNASCPQKMNGEGKAATFKPYLWAYVGNVRLDDMVLLSNPRWGSSHFLLNNQNWWDKGESYPSRITQTLERMGIYLFLISISIPPFSLGTHPRWITTNTLIQNHIIQYKRSERHSLLQVPKRKWNEIVHISSGNGWWFLLGTASDVLPSGTGICPVTQRSTETAHAIISSLISSPIKSWERVMKNVWAEEGEIRNESWGLAKWIMSLSQLNN